MINDVSQCMARRIMNDRATLAQHDFIALAHSAIKAWNFFRFIFRSDNLALPFLFQGEIAAGMIPMMMGIENMGEGPTRLGEFLVDDVCVWRVDGRDSARRLDRAAKTHNYR